MRAFSSHPLTHGPLADLRRGEFPTVVAGWIDRPLSLEADGTHFAFVLEGPAELRCESGLFNLSDSMYFSVPGPMVIRGGRGVVITCPAHRAFFHLGGPVEPHGRLRYIDGCSDSLLVPPVRRGDPCLNLLHLPPGTRQTPHVHPSLRVGLIVRGRGRCVTDEGGVALEPGLAFVIEAGGRHCFHTDGDELLVLAYHPDSDFGPTDEDHPMINRTLVQGGRP